MGPPQGVIKLLRALSYEKDEAPKQHLAFKRYQTKKELVAHANSEH